MTAPAALEQPILHAVRAALVRTGRVLLWRNNSGQAIIATAQGRRAVRYGLGVGSADLVGLLSVPGPHRGRFVAFEVKSATGRQTDEQRMWALVVVGSGGFYAIVRDQAEALAALERAEAGDDR